MNTKQLSLDNYFRVTSKMSQENKSLSEINSVEENVQAKSKKFNLTLKKSPTPKKLKKKKENVIKLCSDDEDIFKPKTSSALTDINSSQGSNESGDISSDLSQKTVIYALSPRIPSTPTTPQTPRRNPNTTSSNSKSPGSRNKFFSPTKKRSVTKRTPVKRKLDQELIRQPCFEDEVFVNACEGMDDKTISLISIINKYLHSTTLKRLLPMESQQLLTDCMHVMKPGMRLICRLYWRKDMWYKQSQLKKIATDKNEMDDPTVYTMLNSLVANRLIVAGTVDNKSGDNVNMTFEDLAALLKVDEMKQICKYLKLNNNSKKDAVEALRSYSRRSSIGNFFTGSSKSNDARVLKLMSEKAGPCYKLSDLARTTLYKLYVLMYLGIDYTTIRDKKLELTIIYDMKKIETYPVDKNMQLDDASVVFENKDQFERYINAHIMYENFLEETDSNVKCEIVSKVYDFYNGIGEDEMVRYKALPLWLRRFTPPYIYVKILEKGVTELKKCKSPVGYDQATHILTTLISQNAFRHHKKGDWYSEKALSVYNMGLVGEAAKVLLEAFKSNLPEELKDSLRPRVRKIANQASDHLKDELLPYADKASILEKNLRGVHVYKIPMERMNQYGKLKFETRLAGERVVQDAEEFCLSHYIESGDFTHGGHWEGRIIITIFFLLFFDIIYKKPRGAVGIFLCHFQMFPLDMFCEGFYTNRKTLIDDRLALIEASTTDDMLNMMSENWNTRPESEMSGINRSIDWDSVCHVARCLGARAASALCQRLAKDYCYASSGFPDLTLWNVLTRKIRFVEVKTDADKPSMKQIQWMHYLRECGIDTEFCYVGANTTRCRARPS